MNGKNIFVTIEYVAKKILEAITGHKSDPQAHPNLSEQINVLSGKIDIGILRSGTLAEYILKHGRNGGVGGNTYEASMTDLPEQRWGMFHVMKHASEVWTVIWYSDYNSTHYKRQLRSEGWVTEWEPIATTSKTDILVTPTNGLKVTGNNVSFVEEIAGIKIYHGELEAAAPISDNPIVLTLPKFTSNTWRPVTFVKQDTKEAYGGWCYHGGQVRASLPAGKYNIDIIYT